MKKNPQILPLSSQIIPQKKLLIGILSLAFLVRLVLAVVTEGYHYDLSCFFAWGLRAADLPLSEFYAEDYFCDYPPGYLYILGFVGQLMTMFDIHFEDTIAKLLLVFFPSVADIATAYLAYIIALKHKSEKFAFRIATFIAFCPAFLYNTAVWKQIDGVIIFLMVASFFALSEKKYFLSAFLFGLGLAMKPQPLILGPVLAVCFALPLFTATNLKARLTAFKNAFLGAIFALLPVLFLGLPFFGFQNLIPSLIEKYFTTAQSYPYATINAFNFMATLGGNWVADTQNIAINIFGTTFTLFFTWKQLGMFSIIILTALLAFFAYKAARNGKFSAFLLGAFYMIGIFCFAHHMHERYLLLGIALLAIASAQFKNPRLLAISGGLSITALINLALVYSVLDTDDNFLTSQTSVIIMRFSGLFATILFLMLSIETWKIFSNLKTKAFSENVFEHSEISIKSPKPQLKWNKKEFIFLSLVTIGIAVLSFSYLGEMTAPQNVLRVSDGSYHETVTVDGLTNEVWVYTGVVKDGANLFIADSIGNEIANISLAQGGLFQWQKYPLPAYSEYILTVTNAEIIEIGFKNIDGNLLKVETSNSQSSAHAVLGGATATSISAMFDEQTEIPDTISQLNSFYFDEIYHARTAYESLEHLPIYETTHPPMGKNFIAMGVAIFGMTGFGWRFSGTLFGVLMLPVLYLFVRRLTRNSKLAGFAVLLLSFDFMRFSQSRISTIDTYVSFFILLSAYFMLWYAQSVLSVGVKKSILPMALCGLAFGFGVASKWTGLYAGAGLAVIYFAVLIARCLQICDFANIAPSNPKPIKQTSKNNSNNTNNNKNTQKNNYSEGQIIFKTSQVSNKPNEKTISSTKETTAPNNDATFSTKTSNFSFGEFTGEFSTAIVGGVLFFVLIPLCIYVASYLPYRLADPSFGLSDLWQNQLNMFDYHSKLNATHPFSSLWYSWPFTLRPVWYYMGGGLAEGMHASIAGLFNPVIVWLGIIAFLRLCYKGLIGKGSKEGTLVIILFLSQFLPWMLVTRCTFLYHFFPCLVFLILAIVLWLKDIAKNNSDRALYFASTVLTLSAFFFVWFYPILSGLPIGELWAKTLHLLPSFGFYIF